MNADWAQRDRNPRALQVPRGLSTVPRLIEEEKGWPVLRYPTWPHALIQPATPLDPRTGDPAVHSQLYRLLTAQPGMAFTENLTKAIPFTPLSGIADGRRFPEMDIDCCRLCTMRITGYMEYYAAPIPEYCYFCYLEHIKHTCIWEQAGQVIPKELLELRSKWAVKNQEHPPPRVRGTLPPPLPEEMVDTDSFFA